MARTSTHKTNCPTCGHEVINEILIDLDCNTVAVGNQTAKLKPRGAELLAILAGKMPGFADLHYIRKMMMGGSDVETSDAIVKVHVSQTRSALRGLPVRIENQRWCGYRLVVTHIPEPVSVSRP